MSRGLGDVYKRQLSALAEKLQPSLEIYADVILNPVFPEAELERLRKITIARIQQEKNRPNSMALRVLPRLLYGEGHPYAQPLTGSGTEATVNALARKDLQDFYDTWFKPNHATLVVVGNADLDQLVKQLNKLFGDWKAGDTPEKKLGGARGGNGNTLYVVDKPGADQSVIFAGQLIPPRANPDEIAIRAVNDILGGKATARINMNLREDKGWSYGYRSRINRNTSGAMTFSSTGQVQADKTAASMQEILGELVAFTGDVPATDTEVDRLKLNRARSLPGSYSTNGGFLSAIVTSDAYGLPYDYAASAGDRIDAVSTAGVVARAQDVIDPDRLTWVVVGDLDAIEEQVRALNYGPVEVWDAFGNKIR